MEEEKEEKPELDDPLHPIRYCAIRFRGQVWFDLSWHNDAFWLMLRELEPDAKERWEVWIPLIEQGVEVVEYGYVYENGEFISQGRYK